MVKAPGMKYRHYAPAEPVVIVSGSREKSAAYIRRHFTPGDRVLCFEEELPLYAGCSPLSYGREADVNTLSAGLFAALRELDDPGIHQVYARCPVGGGVAYAVQNRLKKAAGVPHRGRGGGSMILGITGGTGCGKTTLLNVLKERGAVVLDCDAIYHELLTRDASLLAAIEERFPGTVEDGVLQRKKLGNLVFSDKNALLDLNRITHAAVKREVLRRLGEKPALAAIDAIALFEGGLAGLCDVTVAVTAPVEDRVRRLMRRDGIPEDYARRRIAAQPEESWFREKCGFVLENTGSASEFREKCLAFCGGIGIMDPASERRKSLQCTVHRRERWEHIPSLSSAPGTTGSGFSAGTGSGTHGKPRAATSSREKRPCRLPDGSCMRKAASGTRSFTRSATTAASIPKAAPTAWCFSRRFAVWNPCRKARSGSQTVFGAAGKSDLPKRNAPPDGGGGKKHRRMQHDHRRTAQFPAGIAQERLHPAH